MFNILNGTVRLGTGVIRPLEFKKVIQAITLEGWELS